MYFGSLCPLKSLCHSNKTQIITVKASFFSFSLLVIIHNMWLTCSLIAGSVQIQDFNAGEVDDNAVCLKLMM